MTVLVTGYEPFGSHGHNPSAEVARALDGTTVQDNDVVGEVLPVAFDRLDDRLRTLVDRHAPDLLVATGLNAHSPAVEVDPQEAVSGGDVPESLPLALQCEAIETTVGMALSA